MLQLWRSSLFLVREFYARWVVLWAGILTNKLLYLSEYNPRLGLVITILVYCFARNLASVLYPCLLSKKIIMIPFSSCPPFGKDIIMLYFALLLPWFSDSSLAKSPPESAGLFNPNWFLFADRCIELVPQVLCLSKFGARASYFCKWRTKWVLCYI